LKEEPKEHIKLELLDAQGKVIRAFTSEEKKKDGARRMGKRRAAEHIPAKAGLNDSLGICATNRPRRFPPPSMTKANQRARSFFQAIIRCG